MSRTRAIVAVTLAAAAFLGVAESLIEATALEAHV